MPFTKEDAQYWLNDPVGKDLLRMLRHAEGTAMYGGDPYTTFYGGGQFTDLSKHPDQLILGGEGSANSAAAGAYQFMPTTWNEAQRALDLKDFSANSQDLAAIWLANRKLQQKGKDFSNLRYGDMDREIMSDLGESWASLPNLAGESWYKDVGNKSKPYDELYGIYNERSNNEVKRREALEASKSWLQKGIEKINPFGPKKLVINGIEIDAPPPIPKDLKRY